MKSTQILTAAESGNFVSPGPVRIWSFFGPLAGSGSAGRRLGLVPLLGLLRRLQDGVFHLQDLRLQVAQVFGSHSCRQVSGMLTLSSRSSR